MSNDVRGNEGAVGDRGDRGIIADSDARTPEELAADLALEAAYDAQNAATQQVELAKENVAKAEIASRAARTKALAEQAAKDAAKRSDVAIAEAKAAADRAAASEAAAAAARAQEQANAAAAELKNVS